MIFYTITTFILLILIAYLDIKLYRLALNNPDVTSNPLFLGSGIYLFIKYKLWEQK